MACRFVGAFLPRVWLSSPVRCVLELLVGQCILGDSAGSGLLALLLLLA